MSPTDSPNQPLAEPTNRGVARRLAAAIVALAAGGAALVVAILLLVDVLS